MEVLDKVSNGELSLDTIIEYSEEDYEEGTGILKLKENIFFNIRLAKKDMLSW